MTNSTTCDRPHLVSRQDINDWLESWGMIALYWSWHDVIAVRPDLTFDQAVVVLKHAKEQHDSDTGMNWDALIAAADSLFGPEPEATQEGSAS